jgi:hypothetical protein
MVIQQGAVTWSSAFTMTLRLRDTYTQKIDGNEGKQKHLAHTHRHKQLQLPNRMEPGLFCHVVGTPTNRISGLPVYPTTDLSFLPTSSCCYLVHLKIR